MEMNLEAITKLNKDLRNASKTLSKDEARFLVDSYYIIQEDRKRFDNQIRSLTESGEPHEVLQWFAGNSRTLENQIKNVLDVYSNSSEVGKWSRSIKGIGPVIAAGFIAHIDITQANTAGQIQRYAGLDPTVEWLGKEKSTKIVNDVISGAKNLTLNDVIEVAMRTNIKHQSYIRQMTDPDTGEIKYTKGELIKAVSRRPWNAQLKTLCWKAGESFVKVSNYEDDIYGKLYVERKAYETAKNEAGEYAEQAQAKLDKFNIGKNTEAYKSYIQGKLPKGHIHARAKRYAVKMFLSAWHEIAYFLHYGELPPNPYPIAILGHADQMWVPHGEMIEGYIEARNK